MKNSKVKLNRRRFLLAAGTGSAGAAALLVAVKAGNRTDPAVALAVAPVKPEVQGYHVSAHIEKYYKSTLI